MSSVRLEPLGERHLDAVAALLDDPDVARFTRFPDPAPPDFPRTWLAGYEAGRADGTREVFAVVDAGGGFLGLGLAPAIDPVGRELELGYVVAPEARGRGVATATLAALTEWAFAQAGTQRIRLVIAVENLASRRVAARCGYTLEGVMRSIHHKDDRRVDCELWSRLPGDPG